jgi:hypothetical protein
MLIELAAKRRVAATLPFFVPVIVAVAETDLILTVPRRLAKLAAGEAGVRVVEPPREIKSFPYFMARHPQLTSEPAHMWFREQVPSAVRTVSVFCLCCSRFQRRSDSSRKPDGVTMQFFPVNRLQTEFIKRRGQSLLPLEIDPVEESLLRLRNPIGAVSRALYLKAPEQFLGDVAIGDLNRSGAKFAWKARRHAGQRGRTLGGDSPLRQSGFERDISVGP